jgi:hypothetical protein
MHYKSFMIKVNVWHRPQVWKKFWQENVVRCIVNLSWLETLDIDYNNDCKFERGKKLVTLDVLQSSHNKSLITNLSLGPHAMCLHCS